MSNLYRLSDDRQCFMGQFNQGGEFLISIEDIMLVAPHTWCINGNGYVVARIGGSMVYLHRLLASPPQDMVVDHISGDKLDNRRSNIRVCTQRQNMQNQRLSRRNTSGYIGVSVSGPGIFRAYASRPDGSFKHVGTFHTAIAAALARDQFVQDVYGDYPRLNFPFEAGEACG